MIPLTVYEYDELVLICGEINLGVDTTTLYFPFDITNYSIFLQVKSYNEGFLTNGTTQDSVCAYIEDVGLNYVKCKLCNPTEETQTHKNETVSIFLIKKGFYNIDGKNIWVTEVDGENQDINLPTTYNTTPVIFTTPVVGSKGYGVVRITSRTTSDFNLIVQNVGGVPDKIYVMAIESGDYKSINTYVSTFSADHNPHSCKIPARYVNPEVLLQCQTYNGAQPCWMRVYDIEPNRVMGMVEEPAGYDGYHVLETCGVLVTDNYFYYSSINKSYSVNTVGSGSIMRAIFI